MAENMTDLVTRIDWLQKDGLVGYSARQALSDSDTAYAAAIAVAKACDFWVHTPESNYSPPYSVAFPVIVVDSPIFQCTLGMDGSIEIAEVGQGNCCLRLNFLATSVVASDWCQSITYPCS